jgi:hypothetical protein
MSETSTSGSLAAASAEGPHDIFVSYSHLDVDVTEKIVSQLEGGGLRCWYAKRNISAGEEWAEAILNAIDAALVFVLVFSAASNASGQVHRELHLAAHRKLPMIPFKIEDVPLEAAVEYYTGTAQWLDAREPPIEAHIGKLAPAVRRLLAKAKPSSAASEAEAIHFVEASRVDAGAHSAAREPVRDARTASERPPAVSAQPAARVELHETPPPAIEPQRGVPAERPASQIATLEQRGRLMLRTAYGVIFATLPVMLLATQIPFFNRGPGADGVVVILGVAIAAALVLLLLQKQCFDRARALRQAAGGA